MFVFGPHGNHFVWRATAITSLRRCTKVTELTKVITPALLLSWPQLNWFCDYMALMQDSAWEKAFWRKHQMLIVIRHKVRANFHFQANTSAIWRALRALHVSNLHLVSMSSCTVRECSAGSYQLTVTSHPSTGLVRGMLGLVIDY